MPWGYLDKLVSHLKSVDDAMTWKRTGVNPRKEIYGEGYVRDPNNPETPVSPSPLDWQHGGIPSQTPTTLIPNLSQYFNTKDVMPRAENDRRDRMDISNHGSDTPRNDGGTWYDQSGQDYERSTRKVR